MCSTHSVKLRLEDVQKTSCPTDALIWFYEAKKRPRDKDSEWMLYY